MHYARSAFDGQAYATKTVVQALTPYFSRYAATAAYREKYGVSA